MLHAKFQDRRTLGSGEDLRFLKGFLPYMGVVAILVM